MVRIMEDNTTEPRSSNSFVLALIVVAIIVIGGYLLMRNGSNSSVPTTTQTNTNTSPAATASSENTVSETGQTFTVEGKEFSFSPATLVVSAGQLVSITFTNTGKMPHDFVIDEISGAKTKILQAGESETIQFTPTTAGTFTYYCSVGSHRAQGMEGTLTVQ